LQLTFDIDFGTFAKVLARHFGNLAEHHNTVPLGLGNQLTALPVFIAFVGCQVQVDHCVPVRSVTGIRVLPQIADQYDFVYASCHGSLLILRHW
jgi:hypothetical protein